jgi:hypothetical protein
MFPAVLRKLLQISNLIKIHPVEAELFHVDIRTKPTGMTKLIVVFFTSLGKRLKSIDSTMTLLNFIH